MVGDAEEHDDDGAGAKPGSRVEFGVADGKKGEFYVAVIEKPGRATPELIADLVPPILKSFRRIVPQEPAVQRSEDIIDRQVEQLTRLSEANQDLSNLLAQASTSGSLLSEKASAAPAALST